VSDSPEPPVVKVTLPPVSRKSTSPVSSRETRVSEPPAICTCPPIDADTPVAAMVRLAPAWLRVAAVRVSAAISVPPEVIETPSVVAGVTGPRVSEREPPSRLVAPARVYVAVTAALAVIESDPTWRESCRPAENVAVPL
jgi:hypothetical protein